MFCYVAQWTLRRELILSGPDLIPWSLKSGWRDQRKRKLEIGSRRGIPCKEDFTLLSLGWREPHGKDWEWPLGDERVPSWQTARERRPPACSHRNWILPQSMQLEEVSRCQIYSDPFNALIPVLWDTEWKTRALCAWTSDLKNCELINMHRFKLLSLFCYAATENEYTHSLS